MARLWGMHGWPRPPTHRSSTEIDRRENYPKKKQNSSNCTQNTTVHCSLPIFCGINKNKVAVVRPLSSHVSITANAMLLQRAHPLSTHTRVWLHGSRCTGVESCTIGPMHGSSFITSRTRRVSTQAITGD